MLGRLVRWTGLLWRGHHGKAHTQAREGRGSLLCCFRITSPVVGKHSLCSVFIYTASRPPHSLIFSENRVFGVFFSDKISKYGIFSIYITHLLRVVFIWRSCRVLIDVSRATHSRRDSLPPGPQVVPAETPPGGRLSESHSPVLYRLFNQVTKPQGHPSWPLRLTHETVRISRLHSPLSSAAVDSNDLIRRDGKPQQGAQRD